MKKSPIIIEFFCVFKIVYIIPSRNIQCKFLFNKTTPQKELFCMRLVLARLGGERGIRTLEELSPLTVFKTAAFNHSAISPISVGPSVR